MSADELARAVRERRAELGLSRRAVNVRGGPTDFALKEVETAARSNLRRQTFAKLDRGLGWATGTAHAHYTGRELPPERAAQPEAAPMATAEPAHWYRRGVGGRPTEVATTPRADLSVVAMLARASATEELYALAHVVLDELARREREREEGS